MVFYFTLNVLFNECDLLARRLEESVFLQQWQVFVKFTVLPVGIRVTLNFTRGWSTELISPSLMKN